MRKILQPSVFGLLPGLVVLAAPAPASAASFTRCELRQTDYDCIPGSGVAPNQILTNGATISIAKAAATNDVVAFNWSVKNCQQASNQIRGQVMMIVDNSKSQLTTDVDGARAVVVKNFLTSFASKAANSGVDAGSASYPKIALMNYNGRSGIEDPTDKIDALNAKFTPEYCSATNDLFSTETPRQRWGYPSDASKISICEYLSFASAANASALTNMKNFVDFASVMPRGSTDFTYFFKGATSAYKEITNDANVGRNVVVVTDGLPNVPKYVAAATCRNTPRLANEAIVSAERLGVNQEYCIDRQAPLAISQAHTEALTSPFTEVNVHHVLFTADQTAYFDYDENGKPTLNPAGFLIENSARTGNGKVKFSYARGQTDLAAKLDGLFTQFDKNALQYVLVEVTPPLGSKLSYKAVSPAAPGSSFDIKFVGLQTGNNTVKVTPVYQDGRSSDSASFTVVVADTASANVSCTPIDDNKTVDGDLKGSKDPKGDGFYAAPESGQYRDFRNADEGNKLASEFGIVGESNSLEEYTKLRLQGGTGNCGVISGRTDLNSSRLIFVLFALLSLPVLWTRRSLRRFTQRPQRGQP